MNRSNSIKIFFMYSLVKLRNNQKEDMEERRQEKKEKQKK